MGVHYFNVIKEIWSNTGALQDFFYLEGQNTYDESMNKLPFDFEDSGVISAISDFLEIKKVLFSSGQTSQAKIRIYQTGAQLGGDSIQLAIRIALGIKLSYQDIENYYGKKPKMNVINVQLYGEGVHGFPTYPNKNYRIDTLTSWIENEAIPFRIGYKSDKGDVSGFPDIMMEFEVDVEGKIIKEWLFAQVRGTYQTSDTDINKIFAGDSKRGSFMMEEWEKMGLRIDPKGYEKYIEFFRTDSSPNAIKEPVEIPVFKAIYFMEHSNRRIFTHFDVPEDNRPYLRTEVGGTEQKVPLNELFCRFRKVSKGTQQSPDQWEWQTSRKKLD